MWPIYFHYNPSPTQLNSTRVLSSLTSVNLTLILSPLSSPTAPPLSPHSTLILSPLSPLPSPLPSPLSSSILPLKPTTPSMNTAFLVESKTNSNVFTNPRGCLHESKTNIVVLTNYHRCLHKSRTKRTSNLEGFFPFIFVFRF